MKTRCYINRYATHEMLGDDLKALIPNVALRRRMSRFVRMGVATAMQCLSSGVSADRIDAIVTATGWGCLADSEKFLRNLLEQDEELLNPTPFIQSTFNTIGAQVALLCSNHSYNMTYVHRGHSFESALLDVVMQFDDATITHALVGAADEQTPSQHRVMERMGIWRNYIDGEGAAFFQLSLLPMDTCRACIVEVDFPDILEELKDQVSACGGANSTVANQAGEADGFVTTDSIKSWIKTHYHADQIILGGGTHRINYPTASAGRLVEAVQLIENGARRVAVWNNYIDVQSAVIVVECVG